MIKIRQLEIRVERNTIENIKKEVAYKLKTNIENIIDINIKKQSLDARKKPKLFFVYEIDANVKNEEEILKNNKSRDILKSEKKEFEFIIEGTKLMDNRPVIVGSGPAGLFAAYMLSLYNYNPIIIERGESIDDRVKTVDEFWKTGKLNKNSNVQFGEGGAGTFSDGKLNTLVKDKKNIAKKVLEIFVLNGAPKEIQYLNKPHIGTDILRDVVKNIRNEIIKNGGTFKYNTCLTNIETNNNKLVSIEVNNKEVIKCDNLILAIGHSARDTFKMLNKKNIEMTPKPFAVGLRIQHSQKTINKSQYGTQESEYLKPADYKLTYKAKDGRGVYSFCMCPGGYVVNASSEENMLAINGMSNYKRDTENANSALVVTVTPDDFGNKPLDGIEYQRNLEKKAYEISNGKIPIQLLKDFKENKTSTEIKSISPVFKGNYKFANINDILPKYISNDIKEAINNFNSKIKGYSNDDAILAGIESRTSSPVRIERNELYLSNIEGIYPCGEGAGYSGGITTSAMDGIRVAEAIAKVYRGIK